MGRMNRSRKRKDAMNRVKRERCEKREIARLKKVLGIVEDEGMDIKGDLSDIINIKSAAQLKKEKLEKEEADIVEELREKDNKGENVEVVHEKTKVVHVFNTKTMRDQFGNLPGWMQPRRTAHKLRKVNHSRKLNFNQAWCTQFIPLD